MKFVLVVYTQGYSNIISIDISSAGSGRQYDGVL